MLYYVRHGQTVWNRARRLQGRADSPLTAWGVELALAYGRTLRSTLEGVNVVLYSSPMGRAHQTATLIADVLGIAAESIRVDALLAEHDVGGWQGRTWPEIEREEGASHERLRDWDWRPPGGETRREMFERAQRFLARPRDEPVGVVVSHGGFSRAFRGAWLGLEPGALDALPTHDHGRLFRLRDGAAEEIVLDDSGPPEAALG